MSWNQALAEKHLYNFISFSATEQENVIAELNNQCTVEQFSRQITQRTQALKNREQSQTVLLGAKQSFPSVIPESELNGSNQDLLGMAIIITAGGEGERLRVSLENLGYSRKDLADFTKATFPIPNTSFKGGALEVNLRIINTIAKEIGYDIPVIITTGPSNSITARVIPELLVKNNNFGLRNVQVINQSERFHLTNNNQIVVTATSPIVSFATNPDETGGPLAKLSEKTSQGKSAIEWLKSLGVTKTLILQGTAIYNPALIATIAAAAKKFAVTGVGIARKEFKDSDPYGTFVSIQTKATSKLLIAEKDVRNSDTQNLYNSASQQYLPFNTGFYAVDLDLLSLPFPDYASPDKKILEGITPAPKVGFAATDLLSFSEDCGVVTINPESFKVIKSAEDIVELEKTIIKFHLEDFA